MKKLIALSIMAVIFAVCTAAAFASEDAEDYEFDADSGALTVNTAAGITKWQTDEIEAESVVSLVIGSDITALGGEDFAGMTNLESVVCMGDIVSPAASPAVPR